MTPHLTDADVTTTRGRIEATGARMRMLVLMLEDKTIGYSVAAHAEDGRYNVGSGRTLDAATTDLLTLLAVVPDVQMELGLVA
jgi:hypothetical protein